MSNPVISVLKKTYIILIVLVLAITFFLGYNIYLVDNSLSNLKLTLNKVNNTKTLADAEKLASILDYSLLAEMASPKLESTNIAKVEFAQGILSKPQDMERLGEVKVVLQDLIAGKEKKRSAFLVKLDKVFVLPRVRKIPKTRLKNRAKYLKEQIDTLKDKEQLQGAYYELGNIYTQLDEFSGAKDAYEKAAALNPESDLAKKSLFNIAWNEKHRGNLDEAIKEFEKLAKSSKEEKLINFSKYQMADIYRKKEDYQKAIAIYQDIAATSQADKEMAQLSEFQTGATLLYDLKDYEKAKEVFERLNIEYKGSSLANHVEKQMLPQLASKYRNQGLKLMGEALDSETVQSYEKTKEAESLFNKALEVYPLDAESYSGKAFVFLSLKDAPKALEFARKAVKIAPKAEIASVNLGYLYLQMGMINQAITEYKRFISVESSSSYGYYNLGCAYIAQGSIKEATPLFKKAINLNPTLTSAWNNYGWCLWYQQKFNEALETFENAIKIDPNFINALFNVGAIYTSLGRFDDAKRNFDTVLQLKPSHPEAQQELREVEKIILQQKQQQQEQQQQQQQQQQQP